MARKATDLLDVFRYGGGDDDADRSRTASTPRARKARTPKAPKAPAKRRAFEGLILSKRQLILTGSAMLLLVVLSFVIGLSAGRPGSGRTDPAAQRTTGATMLMIRGAMPSLDPATRRPIDPSEVLQVLARDYHLSARYVTVKVSEGQILIDIGPFRSEQRARMYMERAQVDVIRIHGADPFLRPRILPYSR